jgi:hypothetical protein
MNNLSYRSLYLGIASAFLLFIISCFFSECLDDEPIKIQSLYPPIGCRGETLSIIGWGFGDNASNNVVKINGIATDIVRNIPDMIVVTLPDTVTSGKITVQVGNKIITGPEYSITGPRYFIKFKLGGQQKYFENCDSGYGYDKGCTSGVVWGVWVAVCDHSVSKFTGSVIESWKGQKFSFRDEKHPVEFGFNDEAGSDYRSIDADSQTDSELTIADVVTDPSVIVPNVYIVTGTFKCNVATLSGDDVAITEGEFSVRFNAPR